MESGGGVPRELALYWDLDPDTAIWEEVVSQAARDILYHAIPHPDVALTLLSKEDNNRRLALYRAKLAEYRAPLEIPKTESNK